MTFLGSVGNIISKWVLFYEEALIIIDLTYVIELLRVVKVMPMLLHEEIVARYLIPAIKREMSEELAIRNYKQTEIAKILHVTPAAVTQYLSHKRAQRVNFPPKLKREIRASINQLLETKNHPITPYLVRQELIKIIELARCEKILCELHKTLDSSAPDDCCDLCMRQESCQNC